MVQSERSIGFLNPIVRRLVCLFSVGAMVWLAGQGRSSAQTVKIDHTTLNIDGISQASLDNARALRMSLDHASVGGNILEGMNALQSSDSERYSFANWQWRDRGNPDPPQLKVDQFVAWVNSNSTHFDVFMMKFCFIDQAAIFTYYRDQMLALEAQHPSKIFVWCTMPIQTYSDSQRNAFNTEIRNYCSAHNKPLYDIAAIESDAPGSSEGELMVDSYSSDGGHLSASGALRAAKGIWSLMVQLGGSALPPAGGSSGGAGGAGGSQPAAGGASGQTGAGGSNSQLTGGNSSHADAGGSQGQPSGGAWSTAGAGPSGGSAGSSTGTKGQLAGGSSGRKGGGGSSGKAQAPGGISDKSSAGGAGGQTEADTPSKSKKSGGLCSVAMVGENGHDPAWFTGLGFLAVVLLGFRRRATRPML